MAEAARTGGKMGKKTVDEKWGISTQKAATTKKRKENASRGEGKNAKKTKKGKRAGKTEDERSAKSEQGNRPNSNTTRTEKANRNSQWKKGRGKQKRHKIKKERA